MHYLLNEVEVEAVTMERWRLELLGGLRAMRDNELVERFRTQKTAALLAYFALKPGPQPREVLINLLWPESEPDAARNSLSASLSSLRRQLEPEGAPGSVLLSTRAHVGLKPEAFSCDVADFDAARQAATSASDDAQRITHLAQAVEIYSGSLLPGFYDDWIALEARRREEEFSEALDDLLDLLDGEEDWEQLIRFARHGLGLLPSREEWYLPLMGALMRTGRPEAALRQFEELKNVLARQGEEPSPRALRLAAEAGRTREARQETENAFAAAASVEVPAPVPEVSSPPAPLGLPSPSTEPQREKAAPVTPTFLMMERPAGTREREFVAQTLERHGGQLQRQWTERTLWKFAQSAEAAHAAIEVQVALLVLPAEQRVRIALGAAPEDGGDEAERVSFEHLRVLMQGGHPGQILSDEPSAQAARKAKIALLDLGRYVLSGALPERVFGVECPGAPTFAPPRLVASSASQLPPQFSRFFGREREIASLHRLLLEGGAPIITLLGPGGSGKTRLAIEAARTLGDDQLAIYFVPLADISGESFIFPAVRDAMKLPALTGVSPSEQLLEALRARPTLLILDNFEQLVEEGAPCVGELLQGAPLTRVLVTSRQMLGLPGEREFPVPPLPVPAEDTSAALLKEISSAALFIDRAQASRMDFRVDERNAPYIAAICQRLDGIPLALELAAARSMVLSPAQMLEKLRDRLDILSTRQRGVPERHRTLRTAIEWSFGLLAPELQEFFVSLSVFRGGWTLEAAEEVCEEPDALDFLSRLRECSLVVTQERGDETRFRMLETLREYAATQLKPHQVEKRERLYAGYFARLAQSAEPHLRGPEQAKWLERLDAEQDNFRAVLAWSLEHDDHAALQMATSLSPFWETRGHYAEGRDWLERALARSRSSALREQSKPFVPPSETAPLDVWPEAEAAFDVSSPAALRGRALCNAGRMAWFESQLSEARSLLEKGLELLRSAEDEVGVVNAISSLSMVLSWQGEEALCVASLREGLPIVRRWQQRLDLLPTLANFGWALSFSSSTRMLDESREVNERVEQLARVAGDERSLAWALDSLASDAYWRNDWRACLRLSHESLVLFKRLNEWFGQSHCIWLRGNAARYEGRFAEARQWNDESLDLMLKMKNRVGLPFILESYAYLDIEEGRYERAAVLLGAVEKTREAGLMRHPNVVGEYESFLATLRAHMDPTAFARAWEKGHEMNEVEAFALAQRELDTGGGAL